MNPSKAQKQILNQINELDEMCQDAIQQTNLVQQQRDQWHDKFIKKKQFQQGDWALLFDSQFKDFKGKLATRWLGPYEVEQVFDNVLVRICTIDDHKVSFLVNGHNMRIYQKLMSKYEFVSNILTQDVFDIMNMGESSSIMATQISFLEEKEEEKNIKNIKEKKKEEKEEKEKNKNDKKKKEIQKKAS